MEMKSMIGRTWPRGAMGLCGFVVTVSMASAAPLTWTQATTTTGWGQKHGAVGLVFDGRMWIMGGGAGGYTADVWYSTDGVNWTRTTGGAWSARVYHGGTVFDGRMWVFAGSVSGSARNDVFWSTNGASWSTATSSAGWPQRYYVGQSGVTHDGRMWVMGGQSPFNDVWYSTNGSSWTPSTLVAPWAARLNQASLAFDNKLWVIGGQTSGGAVNDAWSSADGATWVQATSSGGFSRRGGHAGAVANGRMWILSGEQFGGGYAADLWYSTDGASWVRETVPWPARQYFPALVYGNRMYILGGYDGNHRSDVWYADLCIPASVATPPSNQVVCVGGSATFGVTGAGTTPFTYQWRKDGGDLGGQTASTLTIDPAALGDAGVYDVVVSNDCGTVASLTAALTVHDIPSITAHPQDVTASDCAPVVFQVSASSTAVLSYQWRRGGADLSDDWHLSGSNGDTLTIDPAGIADEGAYTVVVTNQCGSVTSGTAVLALDFTGRVDCDSNGIPDECEAGGGDRTWVGASGGSFADAANWIPVGTPGPINTATLVNTSVVDNRCILGGGGLTRVCTLNVGGPAGRQVLQIDAGRTLQVGNSATVDDGGDVDLRGGELAGATVTNLSNSIHGFGTISSNIENLGLIEGRFGAGMSLVLSGSGFANQAAGTLRASLGSAIRVDAAAPVQNGAMDVRPNASLAFGVTLVNASTGVISLLGGAIGAPGVTNESGGVMTATGTIDGHLTNRGDVVVIADLLILGDLVNDGTITVQSGLLTVTGNVSGGGVIIGGFGG